jgi:hypothetical protein
VQVLFALRPCVLPVPSGDCSPDVVYRGFGPVGGLAMLLELTQIRGRVRRLKSTRYSAAISNCVTF